MKPQSEYRSPLYFDRWDKYLDFLIPFLNYMCLSNAYVEVFLNSVPHTGSTFIAYQNCFFFFSRGIFSRKRYYSSKFKRVEALLMCSFFFSLNTIYWRIEKKKKIPDFWIKIQALQPHSKCRLLYFSLRLYNFIEYQNKQRISTPYKVLVLMRRVEGRWTLITLNLFASLKKIPFQQNRFGVRFPILLVH